MIYAKAETAQDIARLLRGDDEQITAAKMADRLLGKEASRGIVITAPRQSGKTVELLKYAEEKNPNGQFAVVCRDQNMQKMIIKTHFLLFNRISQADIVAKKLMGEPLGAIDVNPPLMVSPTSLHLLRGCGRPIYIDELGIMPEGTLASVVETGWFAAAVTS